MLVWDSGPLVDRENIGARGSLISDFLGK